MRVMGFWNNKGGTGKTSLSFQATCAFAAQRPQAKILVIDVCPQANLSQLFLGGQEYGGGANLLRLCDSTPRRSIGGYFQDRLPRPYDGDAIDAFSYLVRTSDCNRSVPENIHILAGDPLLELQVNAMSTLANTQIPGTNSWVGVVKWLIDFLDKTDDAYDFCFIDMNPSFSMYTQIALAACDRLVLPVTADDSSRRGIQNALSLIYGLELPSEIYKQHNFHTRMKAAELNLPKVHLVVKNRLTQYIRTAKGYSAVLEGISSDIERFIRTNPECFTFSKVADGVFDVRDFQTAGVVAFALGVPFMSPEPGVRSVSGNGVTVNRSQRDENKDVVNRLTSLLWG